MNQRKSSFLLQKIGQMAMMGLLFLWPLLLHAQPETSAVYHQIINNIVEQETADVDIVAAEDNTRKYLSQITAEGAFPDIDYRSRAQTLWTPLQHLYRMKPMVLSYISPKSRYYGDAALHKVLVSMLNYWYEADPGSTNWFYREIGWPQPMGLSLSLLRAGKEPVPSALEQKILKRMRDISRGPNQRGSQGTGANKMDIALQWIYRACLQENEADLKFAVQQFFYPIKYNEGQGIQRDDSYLQHGMQLYTCGYGASVLTAFFKVAFYLKDTPFADRSKTDLVSHFVRYGVIPALRGSYQLYNQMGRGVANEQSMKGTRYAQYLRKLQVLDAGHRQLYQQSIDRITGEKEAGYALSPFHRHYWRADYTLHQRKDFTMDVRMASTRVARCEHGNRENLRGYFMSEGGTSIVRRGDEYFNIFPVWDWSRIPGTTTPVMPQVPVPSSWENMGQSTFAGGVSDGTYGVTAYQMVDRQFGVQTSANKSWFFFDQEVVCMGSAIRSENEHPVNTTVNQCLLHGEVEVLTRGDHSPHFFDKGEHRYVDVSCIIHDGICYYFPENQQVSLRVAPQQGSWHHINANVKEVPEEKDIFKLWIDHGVRPEQGKYIYYVVPHDYAIEKVGRKIDDLFTANNDSVQAVYNRTLHTVGAVFYKKGKVRMGDLEIESDQPCTVMISDIHKSKFKLHVADPSYTLDKISLRVHLPKMKHPKSLECQLHREHLLIGTTSTFVIDAR